MELSLQLCFSKLKGYCGVLRPWFWLPALSPAIAGILLAGDSITIKTVLLTLYLFGPGIPGAAEAINDFFDRNYDSLKQRKVVFGIPSSGGSGMIQKSLIKPRQVLVSSISLFLLSLIVASKVDFSFFLLVSVGALIGITYSAPPLRWKDRGLIGSMLIGFAYGFITFNAGYYLVSKQITFTSTLIGILLSIFIAGYGSIFALADYNDDKKNNIMTFPVRVGLKRAAKTYSLFMLVPYVCAGILLLLGILKVNVWLFALLLVATTYMAFRLIRNCSNEKGVSKIHLFGVLLESFAPFLFV